jgi:ATP-binding cassette subfamily D (ALD) long-chain fatty acid import protein
MNQGTNYVIDSLPEGYAVFDRPRGTNPDIVSLATEDLSLQSYILTDGTA